ncbi:MAG: nitronate monooxygenase [Deltaproteobacteria bacterium]|nr:nitronate monooxygenase [Deltaproteobacteria bacterium]MBW2298458.1 nitronate monooxygenase [Deltaproteobacteria bacterium]MBW2613704.1 nitronate monooxygenase [Deltaproteobacteria bacterium]MBW2634949.1 nitronate monooxygenase [Deltaproteobacteria bacterium]MBW2677933.1 nitronate monooxygenase [Deltaproteobacteria bacterium]
MFKTRITEMLGIQYPILSGGMQWLSRAEFVAAVGNAGGIGFITAESFETPEDLRTEIKKMHTLTDKPFGVNISMVPEFGVPERSLQFCDVVVEEGVKVVETAGQSPKPLMPKLKDAGIKVIHKMTSIRHAESAQKLGVDAITLIGYGSGGHIGMDNVASFILIPMAVSRLDIPVVAGGGVCNGKGFLGAMAMGAEAVLMGTAFFATEECPVHDAIKQRLVQTRENETCLLLNSLQNPVRCVRNQLADECLALEEKNASFEEIINTVAGGKGKLAYDCGDAEISPIACGQIVGAIDEVKSVKAVIDDMIDEAGTMMARLNGMTK